MSMTKWGLSVIGFVVLVGLIGSVSDDTDTAYDAQAEQERRERIRQTIKEQAKTDYAIRPPIAPMKEPETTEPEASKPALELLSSEGASEEYATRIKGVVRNNSRKNYRLVRMSFDIFDEQGNRVGNALDTITGLDRGETWKFDAIYAGSDGDKFRLDEVSGF